MITLNNFIKLCRQSLCLFIIFLISAHTANHVHLPFISKLENMFYDLRLITTMSHYIDERIVIVNIDEKSLLKEGRWPWSRNKLAHLVDRLFDDYAIDLLGFDIVFSEKDQSSGLTLLEEIGLHALAKDKNFQTVLKQLRTPLSYDTVFAQSFNQRKIVLGYFASHVDNPISHETQLPPAVSVTDEPYSSLLFQAKSYGANLTSLQQAAQSGGFFNNLGIDNDGVSRRLPLLFKYNHRIYESLALAMVRLSQDQAPLELMISDDYGDDETGQRLEGLKIKSLEIPVDYEGALLIPYHGQQGFVYVSATDVLNKQIEPQVLANKIVLVGTTAAGLFDLQSTPIEKNYPGVEIHANVMSGILNKTLKYRPNDLLISELFLLLVIGGLMIWWMPKLSVIKATLLFMSLILIILILNLYLWVQLNIDSHLATPLLLLFSLFGVQLFFGYFFESRRKKQLGRLFSQYIPPELVEQMSKTDGNFSLTGRSKEMSVFFSDIRDFTSLSENLPPKELCDLINAILTPITQIIHHHKGTIDKYIGDAVMAFWGAPLENNHHAHDAISAGLEIIEHLQALQADFQQQGYPPIKLGIGINTGIMSVGNMGSQFRTAYTVMGDSVNLGSRLEGLTKYYGVDFIVSEHTQMAAPRFIYRELDKVQVKGKKKPVIIYEVIGLLENVSSDYLAYLQVLKQAFSYYYQQNWDNAQQMLQQLHQQNPHDKLHPLYLKRIETFKAYPPEKNWNGVFIHTQK